MTTICGPGIRHVLLHGFELLARVGIHPNEHDAPQRIRVQVDLGVRDEGEAARAAGDESVAGVVNYEPIAAAIRAIVGAGHVRLVETLAERIARACLAGDERVRSARIRVEKLDVFPDVAAAGVEIERRRE